MLHDYEGGVRERDGAYHQGTVWPWLLGAFVEAWLRVHGNTHECESNGTDAIHTSVDRTSG